MRIRRRLGPLAGAAAALLLACVVTGFSAAGTRGLGLHLAVHIEGSGRRTDGTPDGERAAEPVARRGIYNAIHAYGARSSRRSGD